MKKILFVVTHLGNEDFVRHLKTSTKIDGPSVPEVEYDVPEKFFELTRYRHKQENASAIYVDQLVHNHQLTCRAMLPHCKFIYLLRRPQFGEMRGYTLENAVKYYLFRLRGMAEYYFRAPGLIVTEPDWKVIGDYLGTSFEPYELPECSQAVPECEEAYERYLALLRSERNPFFGSGA